MDQRDLALLDKQLRGLNPPRNDRVVGIAVVAVFFIGMAVGGVLFASAAEPTRTAANIPAASILSQSTSAVQQ
jgi:hypothetical protein